MNRWLFLMVVIGSTIAIITPLSFLTDKDTQPIVGNYLFAGLIVEGIVIFMIQQTMDSKKHLQDRRQLHTEDLNHIYLRLTDVGFTEEQKNLALDFPEHYNQFNKFDNLEAIFDDTQHNPLGNRTSQKYFYLSEDYYYFDYAIEHLKHKNYKNIYRHWEKANNIIDEFNNSPKFIDKLEETMKTKIRIAFPEFKEIKNSIHDGKGDFYSSNVILNFILNVLKNREGQEINLDFLIIHREEDEYSICTHSLRFYGQLSSTDEKKIDLDKYKLTIISIIQDKEVQQLLTLEIKKRLELFDELQELSKEISVLIKKLKAGSILEGKCEACSTFS